MHVVEIVRLEEHEQYGTFGVMKIDKAIFCVTLEPPDFENEQRISSIPAQQYFCKPYNSPTYGWTWQVMNVPGRTYVLFHAGNRVKDTEACILTAEKFGKLYGDRAVLNSGETFKKFKKELYNEEVFSLTIHEKF